MDQFETWQVVILGCHLLLAYASNRQMRKSERAQSKAEGMVETQLDLMRDFNADYKYANAHDIEKGKHQYGAFFEAQKATEDRDRKSPE